MGSGLTAFTKYLIYGRSHLNVAAERILTTRADCALTSVCRLPVVVNRRSV